MMGRAFPALRVAVSAGLAGALTALVWSRLPQSLNVNTDIVGYPTFANFNINRYLWFYWLVALFLPLAAIVIDLLLSRLTRRLSSRTRSTPRPSPPALERPAGSGRITGPTVGLGRTLFVGGVLGLEAAIVSNLQANRFAFVALPTLLLYCGAAAVAGAVPQRRWSFWDRLAAVNALGAALTVLGLYGVSASTELRVAGGDVHEYPWFPLWLSLILTGALAATAALWLWRAVDGERVRSLERRMLLLVAGPALLFLFVAFLPGEASPIDLFHDGELLAAADLTERGAFPWRDLLFIHGLVQDVAAPLLGFNVFEASRWGYLAGSAMLIGPAYWLCQYFLFAYLFRGNILFLAGTQLAVVLGVITDVHVRYVLMPLVLLLLAALLRNATRLRAAALSTLLVLQTVVSPETAFAIPACLAVLALYELSARERGRPVLVSFRRTFLTVIIGAAAILLWFAVLAAQGALDDFLFFYRTFSPDHQLTGGIPLFWSDKDDRFRFAAVAPVVAIVLAIWYFAIRTRLRRPIPVDDWVVGALAIVVLLYYPKFLSRADGHVYQPFAVAVPLLAYALYRAISFLDELVSRVSWRLGPLAFPARYAVTGIAVVVLLTEAPGSLVDTARAIPARFAVTVAAEPTIDRLGYTQAGAVDAAMITDLDRIVDAYLEPGDRLFDFSNTPALFYFLLDRRPSTRYYHVSMAIRKFTQSDLLAELELRRPKLVVFSSSAGFGLSSWDGISNQVRHYEISQYILERYRPVLLSHGFLLMTPKGAEPRVPAGLAARLAEPPVTDQLYFHTLPCDWGFTPNFLSTGPSEDAVRHGLSLPFGPAESRSIRVTGWAVDVLANAPARTVVAAVGERVIARAVPREDRPDVAAAMGDPRFRRSGFALELPSSWQGRMHTVRLYAVTRTRLATELTYGPGTGLAPTSAPPASLVLAQGQRSVRVLPVAGAGVVDVAIGASAQTLVVEVPQQARRAEYDWLEIRTRSPLSTNSFGLTDDLGDPTRKITFKTLAEGETDVHVQVGSCSQWHGYEHERLYLEVSQPERISTIALMR
jgi:hypothetical protein